MNKKLYLIAGANGSGKTTLAYELLREEKDLTFLNADDIAAKTGDKTGISAGRTLLTEAKRLLADGKPFVMESTVSGNYHLRILKEAREKGYEINLIYVFLNTIELNIARIKNRVLLGGHDVPTEDVVRRYHKSIKNFWAIAAIVDFWKLYHNGNNGCVETANGSGELVEVLDEYMYNRFKGGLSDA
jgi:predicted ABC-type ATPase